MIKWKPKSINNNIRNALVLICKLYYYSILEQARGPTHGPWLEKNSSIMCTRLFKIIEAHRVSYQFGLTPGVGCQDGNFTIKTMLHLCHNYNLLMWVMFADLVKVFDASNHVLMIKIMKKYGCPPNLCSAIRRMYKSNKGRLNIGKIDTSIPFEVGVKQGDSVAPVLFLFLIMALAEVIEKEWDKR